MALPIIALGALAFNFLPVIAAYALLNRLSDRDFDGLNQSPDVLPQLPPYELPFEGGQCRQANRGYWVSLNRFYNPNVEQEFTNATPNTPFEQGNIAIPAAQSVVSVEVYDAGFFQGLKITHSGGVINSFPLPFGNSSGDIPITDFSFSLFLYDYGTNSIVPDNCGDLPNPNDPIPESVGGGALQALPNEVPIQVVEGGIPVGILGILQALAAIAQGIKAIGDVLDGVRAIGDAIEKLKDFFQEKEKEEPKAAKIWAGSWSEIRDDGGFSLITQIVEGQVLYPNFIQIEIENFPKGASFILGRKSPSFCDKEPLGYILPRGSNECYSEPIPVRFLRCNVPLFEDCRGISWNFRRYPSLKAKCRVWYASKPD